MSFMGEDLNSLMVEVSHSCPFKVRAYLCFAQTQFVKDCIGIKVWNLSITGVEVVGLGL